jgi:hypothetical protein
MEGRLAADVTPTVKSVKDAETTAAKALPRRVAVAAARCHITPTAGSP